MISLEQITLDESETFEDAVVSEYDAVYQAEFYVYLDDAYIYAEAVNANGGNTGTIVDSDLFFNYILSDAVGLTADQIF